MTDVLIDAATIADLSLLDISAMNESFTLTSPGTPVSDGGGGTTPGTPVTATTVGYLWSVSGDEAGTDQIKALGKHRVAVPKTVTVLPTATITQVSTGKVFEIKYVFPTTAYSTSLIIGLEDA
jgi:hypothetical protein